MQGIGGRIGGRGEVRGSGTTGGLLERGDDPIPGRGPFSPSLTPSLSISSLPLIPLGRRDCCVGSVIVKSGRLHEIGITRRISPIPFTVSSHSTNHQQVNVLRERSVNRFFFLAA